MIDAEREGSDEAHDLKLLNVLMKCTEEAIEEGIDFMVFLYLKMVATATALIHISSSYLNTFSMIHIILYIYIYIILDKERDLEIEKRLRNSHH